MIFEPIEFTLKAVSFHFGIIQCRIVDTSLWGKGFPRITGDGSSTPEGTLGLGDEFVFESASDQSQFVLAVDGGLNWAVKCPLNGIMPHLSENAFQVQCRVFVLMFGLTFSLYIDAFFHDVGDGVFRSRQMFVGFEFHTVSNPFADFGRAIVDGIGQAFSV